MDLGSGRGSWDFWVDELVSYLLLPFDPTFPFCPATYFPYPFLATLHSRHPYPYQLRTMESLAYAQAWEGDRRHLA